MESLPAAMVPVQLVAVEAYRPKAQPVAVAMVPVQFSAVAAESPRGVSANGVLLGQLAV